jgi:hypothetical protein
LPPQGWSKVEYRGLIGKLRKKTNQKFAGHLRAA